MTRSDTQTREKTLQRECEVFVNKKRVFISTSPDLTWRDMQHVIVHTARVPSNADDDNDWTQNGAGFHVNPRFGFGAMDCARMVEVAQNWTTVGEHHQCDSSVDHADKSVHSNFPCCYHFLCYTAVVVVIIVLKDRTPFPTPAQLPALPTCQPNW